MPAPETEPSFRCSRPIVGHVNLMLDTLIANASADELRTIVRTMITSTPGAAPSFLSAARGCLRHSERHTLVKQTELFETRDHHGRVQTVVTARLYSLLSYTRSLYGAGMGFDSLEVFTGIVRGVSGLHWNVDDALPNDLAIIDADIDQAIQSCREEVASGNVKDAIAARTTLLRLRAAFAECRSVIGEWGGEFPFTRGSANADCLRV